MDPIGVSPVVLGLVVELLDDGGRVLVDLVQEGLGLASDVGQPRHGLCKRKNLPGKKGRVNIIFRFCGCLKGGKNK